VFKAAWRLLPTSRGREAIGCLRQAIDLPFCAAGLLLDYLADALGGLAAWIAGGDWP
jgi:hypothetical protein